MTFSSSVDALLEFYSTCISLLKTSKSKSGGDGAGAGAARDREQLRRSMRSDRAQVRRAYSSGLSESGSRFRKGDARAKSSLSRVLKRLTTVIASILQLSSKHNQQPVLDCESLMLLSNASRVQAVQTCDRLSRRLRSSPSSSSVASSSTKSKHKRQKSSGSVSSSKSGRSKRSSTSSAQSPTRGQRKKSDNEKPKERRRSSDTPSPTSTKSHHDQVESGRRKGVPKRISMVSTSTYSTRLGEIPERKWISRYSYDSSNSEEYNVPPVYPLKPFEPPEKRSRFRDLFRRRS